MILTLRALKEYVVQALHVQGALSLGDDFITHVFNLLDQLWIHINDNSEIDRTTSNEIIDFCESIASDILKVTSGGADTNNLSRYDLQKIFKENSEQRLRVYQHNLGKSLHSTDDTSSISPDVMKQSDVKCLGEIPCKTQALLDNFKIKNLLEYQAFLCGVRLRPEGTRHSSMDLCQEGNIAGRCPAEHAIGIRKESISCSLQSDLELIRMLDAVPVIPKNQQPSILAAIILGEYVMTPDVRPSDRRCVSDFVIKPMGALWNEFIDEIDTMTLRSLDRNYSIPSTAMDFNAELLKTCADECAELMVETDAIRCPNIIDINPTLQLARDHCQDLNMNPLCKPKSIETPYSLTKKKEKCSDFQLHNEDSLTAALHDMRLPNSKLDTAFLEEIDQWRKPGTVRMNAESEPLTENELFIALLKSRLNEERKLYLDNWSMKDNETYRQKLRHENGQWNPKIMLPDGLLNLGQRRSDEQHEHLERIKQMEQDIQQLSNAQCFIGFTKPQKTTPKHIASYKDLQDRLERAWTDLLMPDEQRTELLTDLCLTADQKYETIIGSANTSKYVATWEKAAYLVKLRESLVFSEAQLELDASDPKSFSKSGTANERVMGARKRTNLLKDFENVDQQIHDVAATLKKDYNCTLTFKGAPYLDKTIHDRSDLHYHIHQFRNQINTEPENELKENTTMG